MDRLRIIPLGGVEEVGKNCTVLEYLPNDKSKGDIIVVDFGLDFPGPDFPGINYFLPDIGYLEENKERIKGIVITHGHLDHIGAISYLLHKLGNQTIYATPLTLAFIQERLAEPGFKKQKINLKVIDSSLEFQLGVFKIIPFRVVHNIPDSIGLGIETPLGIVIHTGDFKIDDNPVDQRPLEREKLKKMAKKGVIALLSDSTNATLPGHSLPEREVGKIIKKIVKECHGRIIFTTFSTLISRIQQVIYACEQCGRKIALVGMAMEKSVKIAQELDYLKVPKNIFINSREIEDYPNHKVLIMAGGAQGVEGSSMERISEKEHWLVRIKKGDTVIFSSSAIPGNELAIHQVMDGLVNQGAKIIYRAVLGSGVHSSGHAFQEEQKEMIRLTKPKFFIPIEGQHYMQASHIELARGLGIQEKNCFMLYNGQILEINKNKEAKILKNRIPSHLVAVENDKVKILDWKIINERKKMACSGVCIISSFRQGKNYKIEIAFQGFSLNEELIKEIKQKTIKLLQNQKNLKNNLQNSLSDYILSKTGKKPIVFFIAN